MMKRLIIGAAAIAATAVAVEKVIEYALNDEFEKQNEELEKAYEEMEKAAEEKIHAEEVHVEASSLEDAVNESIKFVSDKLKDIKEVITNELSKQTKSVEEEKEVEEPQEEIPVEEIHVETTTIENAVNEGIKFVSDKLKDIKEVISNEFTKQTSNVQEEPKEEPVEEVHEENTSENVLNDGLKYVGNKLKGIKEVLPRIEVNIYMPEKKDTNK